jgi:hypothetical protein
VLSINGIHALVDVTIVDPTQVEWVLCIVSSCEVIAKLITQIKGHYCDNIQWMCFFLALKVYGCLHQ